MVPQYLTAEAWELLLDSLASIDERDIPFEYNLEARWITKREMEQWQPVMDFPQFHGLPAGRQAYGYRLKRGMDAFCSD